MPRVSFAQNIEDVVLWRALGDVRWGHYLDIGAQDPVVDSVSQSFYREGWRGISVEPNPAYARALRDNRPDEEVVEAAVGNGSEPIEFFVIPETGLSTSDPELAETYRQQGRVVHEVTVPVVPLSDLLARFAGEELHWLKIDVDGMERAVLESWGEATVRPWIVVVESIDPVTQKDNAGLWRELIEARRYHEILFDGGSRYFVADEHAELGRVLGTPASSLDDFSVRGHHWFNSTDMFTYDDRDPYHRAENLADLCRFTDVDFIRCAFVTMVGRQSDPDGEAHFLGCLRRGDTKLSILRALRLSDEGRQHDPGIAGLDRALKRDHAARRKWTGWLVRLFTGAEGNSPLERQLRSLRNAVEAEREVAARRAALLASGQERLISEMRQVQSLVRSGTSGVSGARIAQAEGGGQESWERVLGSFLRG